MGIPLDHVGYSAIFAHSVSVYTAGSEVASALGDANSGNAGMRNFVGAEPPSLIVTLILSHLSSFADVRNAMLVNSDFDAIIDGNNDICGRSCT